MTVIDRQPTRFPGIPFAPVATQNVMVGHEIWYPLGSRGTNGVPGSSVEAIASPPTISPRRTSSWDRDRRKRSTAFKCCEANHAPFFQKCTSPLLSTAAQNVVDGQDTALRDERSRTSTVCAFDHVPVVGAAEATSPSVMTHAVSNTMVITLRRMQ